MSIIMNIYLFTFVCFLLSIVINVIDLLYVYISKIFFIENERIPFSMGHEIIGLYSEPLPVIDFQHELFLVQEYFPLLARKRIQRLWLVTR